MPKHRFTFSMDLDVDGMPTNNGEVEMYVIQKIIESVEDYKVKRITPRSYQLYGPVDHHIVEIDYTTEKHFSVLAAFFRELGYTII